MRNTKNEKLYRAKRTRNALCICALFFCLLFLFVGCVVPGQDPPATAPPELSGETEEPVIGAATPTPQNPIYETPIADVEIVFNDRFLEDVIRAKIKKSLGSVYVSDVAQITSLTARVEGIRNIEVLRYFTSLEVLDLYGNRISDLSPLSDLTNLKELDISRNYVGFLDKTGGTGMNLQPLSSLVRLEILSADENGITDLSPLAGLVNLKKLSIEGNVVSSMEGLSRLTQLEEIRAGKNHITDISQLEGLVNLKTLSLESNCFIEKEPYAEKGLADITALESLTSLRWLNISYNYVNSLEPLSKLPNLEYLNASNNSITDMECMRGSGVKRLDLGYNKIQRVDAILEMPALEEFWYQGNKLGNNTLALEIFLFKRDHPDQPLPPELSEALAAAGEEDGKEDPEDGGEETEDSGGQEEGPGENPGGGNNTSSDPVSYDKVINNTVQQGAA